MLSSRTNYGLHRLKVSIAGCGLSNTGTFPTTIKTAILKIIKKTDCEEIGLRISGRREVIEDRYFCTIANPYALMNSVSYKDICYLIKILKILQNLVEL
jgi:hypothetical protein